jgi:hypothetical protein
LNYDKPTAFTMTSRIVPNYELPPALERVEILRVVIRENITEVVHPFFLVLSCLHSPFPQLVDQLINDIVGLS